jgi:hypothetical protein
MRRGARWRAALKGAVSDVAERADGYVLTLRGDERTYSRFLRLVAAEKRCCDWMKLELLRDGPAITLTIGAETKEGKAVIASMLEPLSELVEAPT